jgi:tetratricopeptide (TPR) repeat protein
LTEEERKKALARKLRLSQPNLRLNIPSSVSPPSIPPKEQIAEHLKRQYAQGRQSTNLGHLQELLSDAERALEKGDPVQASNHLRAAQSIAPNDPRVAERLAETQSQAATALASTYLKQAEYEEKSGRFDAAARSYERAARGLPQANSWESAARCLLEAGGDLRSAGEFAKRAIALEPERPSSHLLLGRIFIAARMRSSAVAELERARSLDPNNDTVTSLLKRLERESF